MNHSRARPALFSIALAAIACSGHPASSTTSGGGGAGGSSACDPGRNKVGDACVDPVLADCNDAFIDADGICRPSIDKCEKGQIPDFRSGCVPVGIRKCAAAFLEDDGLCHPRSSKCAGDELAVPSEGCVSLDGDPGCGQGTWGAIADAAGTVYVDQGYTGGGSDGSKSKPFSTVAEAVAVAQPHHVVAIAAGAYGEPVALDEPITLQGRCASKVALTGVDADAHIVTVTSSGARISGVTISGMGIGVDVEGAVNLDITDVAIDGAAGVGVRAFDGATVTLDHCLVRGTVALGKQGDGQGIWARGGTQLTIRRSAIVGNLDEGVSVNDKGTALVMSDSLVEGTVADFSSAFGAGVEVHAGARATIDASAFFDNGVSGIDAFRGGATATVTDSLFEGVPSSDIERSQYGVQVSEDGTADIAGSAFMSLNDKSVHGLAGLKLRSSLVRDTGIQFEGGHVTLQDDAIVHVSGITVAALGLDSTSIDVERVLIEDAVHRGPEVGVGFGAVLDVTFRLEDVYVKDVQLAGMFISIQSKGTAARVIVSGVKNGSFVDPKTHVRYESADGIAVTKQSQLDLDDARLTHCARSGLFFDSSGGSVVRAQSTHNAIGVATQGMPKPTVGKNDNSIEGNDQDEVTDADLAVPNVTAKL